MLAKKRHTTIFPPENWKTSHIEHRVHGANAHIQLLEFKFWMKKIRQLWNYWNSLNFTHNCYSVSILMRTHSDKSKRISRATFFDMCVCVYVCCNILGKCKDFKDVMLLLIWYNSNFRAKQLFGTCRSINYFFVVMQSKKKVVDSFLSTPSPTRYQLIWV